MLQSRPAAIDDRCRYRTSVGPDRGSFRLLQLVTFFVFCLHCDFWYKASSASEATRFGLRNPTNLHIRASLAFIHHELPPTQQMFRWGVLSSNLFYVDLLISDARGALGSSDTCQRLPLAASTSFSHCAKLRKRKHVACYPGAHMETLASVHNYTNAVFVFLHKLTAWFVWFDCPKS